MKMLKIWRNRCQIVNCIIPSILFLLYKNVRNFHLHSTVWLSNAFAQILLSSSLLNLDKLHIRVGRFSTFLISFMGSVGNMWLYEKKIMSKASCWTRTSSAAQSLSKLNIISLKIHYLRDIVHFFIILGRTFE